MVAEASIPDEANKRIWWKRVLEQDSEFEKMSIQKSREVMGAFHHEDFLDVTQFTEKLFFATLPQLVGKFPDEFVGSFAGLMYPIQCTPQLENEVTEFLQKHPALPVNVNRQLRLKRQLYQRTLAARALSEETGADRRAHADRTVKA